MISVPQPEARLDVDGLRVRLGAREILGGVSLSVRTGEVLAVVGPNGAGKTTLLECIAGLRRAEAGTVAWQAHALHGLRQRARVMSFMPDEVVLPSETNVAVALGIDPRARVVENLAVGSLLAARGDELSRGEAKRVQLAAALAPGRPVVLLDEPFAAFDPRQLRAILPAVSAATREAAVVVTVHQMRTAELVADRLLLLADGRVLALGTIDDLRARARLPGAPLDDVVLALLDAAATGGAEA
jgi:ABC-type multidrug transport system ATPase subunit